MVLFRFFQKLLRNESPHNVISDADLFFLGLGNKGNTYASTRHNIGFRIADALAARLENRTKGSSSEIEYYCGSLFEVKKVAVIKPLTFMNRSGIAVEKYLPLSARPRSSILVIVDDFNLPLGRLRIRKDGSDGGHNGLKSIIDRIGDDFPRLRFGIGPLPEGSSSVDFVLGPFTGEEESILTEAVPRAVDACCTFARKGIDAAMNTVNR
jgi:peptidyl-tRNA hydrolase, PTH1 family